MLEKFEVQVLTWSSKTPVTPLKKFLQLKWVGV